MKTGFKDPIAIREKSGNAKFPTNNFAAPPYDERTSCFISAGQDYGVGHTQPVGSIGGGKNSDALPQGRVDTLKLHDYKKDR